MNNKEALKFLKDVLSEKKLYLKDIEEEVSVTKIEIEHVNHMIDVMKSTQAKDSKPSTKKISEKTKTF